MGGFGVLPRELHEPVQRFKQISLDLSVANGAVGTAADRGAGAAGEPVFREAAEIFKSGMQGVLSALSDDVGLLGDNVRQAGVLYEVADANAMPTDTGQPGQPGTGAQPAAYPGHSFSYGTPGDPSVTLIQQRLAETVGYTGGTGQYGPKTEAAVRAFQERNGLDVDGVVGPQTWKKLVGGD